MKLSPRTSRSDSGGEELEDGIDGDHHHQWADDLREHTYHRSPPVLAYPLLFAVVLAVSSAATVFSHLKEVPPITIVSWRLQLTALLLLPGCVVNVKALGEEDAQRLRGSRHLLLASGVCLAVHFACFVWGLRHTSLTHSLLFVSASPLIIALGSWLLWMPISRPEIAGTILGSASAAWLAVAGSSGGQGRVTGDAASLAGAVAIVGYLGVGRTLRSWMPIFLYSCPVTACAAVLLSLTAMVAEGSSLLDAGAHGTVGWLPVPRYLLFVLYLAVGPGIVGHCGINLLLRWFSPLVLSLVLTSEPLVGSCIGWLFGVSPAPSSTTWAAGTAMLAAIVIVTAAAQQREAGAAAAAAAGASSPSLHSAGPTQLAQIADQSAADVSPPGPQSDRLEWGEASEGEDAPLIASGADSASTRCHPSCS